MKYPVHKTHVVRSSIKVSHKRCIATFSILSIRTYFQSQRLRLFCAFIFQVQGKAVESFLTTRSLFNRLRYIFEWLFEFNRIFFRNSYFPKMGQKLIRNKNTANGSSTQKLFNCAIII